MGAMGFCNNRIREHIVILRINALHAWCLVIKRHNEIRNYIGGTAALVWTQVVREPIVREAETQVGD